MTVYPLHTDDRVAEDARLIAQGCVFDPMTRRLLQQAGITWGMRVLDIGSGAGNVSRVAAEMVGPTGSVIGVEKDPAAVELARQHSGAPNIEYRAGDVQTLDGIGGGFDAVIGRLVRPGHARRPAAIRRPGQRQRHVRPADDRRVDGLAMTATTARAQPSMLAMRLVSCPECSAPAEITERFRLPSTDGPVDHIVLRCAAGHHFRMPADMLPALQPRPRATNDQQPEGLPC